MGAALSRRKQKERSDPHLASTKPDVAEAKQETSTETIEPEEPRTGSPSEEEQPLFIGVIDLTTVNKAIAARFQQESNSHPELAKLGLMELIQSAADKNEQVGETAPRNVDFGFVDLTKIDRNYLTNLLSDVNLTLQEVERNKIDKEFASHFQSVADKYPETGLGDWKNTIQSIADKNEIGLERTRE